MAVGRARLGRLLVVVLASAPLALVTSGPAAAQPPVGLNLEDLAGNEVTPFVGEEFFAQSDARETPGGRENWTCHVDFGDGATGGYWRAHAYDQLAPCAAAHTYAAAGTYTLVMTITDNLGGSVSEQRELVVGPRPVVARDAGVEGTPVTLPGPEGAATVEWSLADDDRHNCRIAKPFARDATVTCFDDGTFRVTYDTDDAATSGAYDVTWVNGAPRPTMRATRTMLREDGSPYYVPVRRVGTGDQVRFDARAHDPSTHGIKGDPMRCVFEHGNGRRETQVAYEPDGSCNGLTSYLAPGRHTSRVRVVDDDRAEGVAQASVVVVRRDVHLRVRDIRRGRTSGVVAAHLTPRGLVGRVDLRFPGGRRLVATRLTSLQVTSFGSVTLLGRARVDGTAGYRFVLFPDRSYPQGIAFSAYAWHVDDPDDYVLQQNVYRNDFRVRLHAPPVH